MVMTDADGPVLDLYCETHIPGGPGYQGQFGLTPGDTGFPTWNTAVGHICVGMLGPVIPRNSAGDVAEVFLYPTAIGSELQDASVPSLGHC